MLKKKLNSLKWHLKKIKIWRVMEDINFKFPVKIINNFYFRYTVLHMMSKPGAFYCNHIQVILIWWHWPFRLSCLLFPMARSNLLTVKKDKLRYDNEMDKCGSPRIQDKYSREFLVWWFGRCSAVHIYICIYMCVCVCININMCVCGNC